MRKHDKSLRGIIKWWQMVAGKHSWQEPRRGRRRASGQPARAGARRENENKEITK